MYHWLIIKNSTNNIDDLLNALPLNMNSDVHLVIQNNSKTMHIYDVYNAASKHGGQLNISHVGYYDDVAGYKFNTKGNKYWKRKNMTGVKFKTAIVVPHLKGNLNDYLANQDNRQIDSMHRFQMTTVNYCKDMYNFSLNIQRTNSWGYKQQNGKFDGLVSLLEHREIDFGSSPLIYKLDRMPVVDYSYGNWILKSTFIYRRPKVIGQSHEIFLRPLATNTWTFIIIFMLIILLALRFTFSTENYFLDKLNSRVDSSWSFLILFTLGAFCQQGATCYPKLICSRILSVFVFLFCILIYQFYSASIVSYLLMDPPRTINNLKDLVDSHLRVGIEDILIDRDYFVQTTDPDAIDLYNQKIKVDYNHSGFYSPDDGLKMVKDGGFAFHVETSTAYPIIENSFSNEEICDLEEVQMYRTQPMHTNLQKHSPFRELFNFCMLKIVESGNMFRLRKYWDARKPTCIEAAKKIEIHVTLKEFSSGLIVLSYGVFISLLFLLGEVISYYKQHIWEALKNRNVTRVKPFQN